jgi:hypothetical protein
MVNAASILILFTLTSLGAAVPAPEAEIVHSDFSFSEWVETLISDPDHALTPEQALEAAKASIEARSPVDKRQSQVDCIQRTGHPAGVRLISASGVEC